MNPIPRRERQLAERESGRWIETAQRAKPLVQRAATVTVVADRKANIYALWTALPEPH